VHLILKKDQINFLNFNRENLGEGNGNQDYLEIGCKVFQWKYLGSPDFDR